MVPLDLTENGISTTNFGMLGLGDIVVPGNYRLAFSSRLKCLVTRMSCVLFLDYYAIFPSLSLPCRFICSAFVSF